jgi:hypothetical protein
LPIGFDGLAVRPRLAVADGGHKDVDPVARGEPDGGVGIDKSAVMRTDTGR